MSYNLLLDTKFTESNWKFTNCRYENGYLISTDKIFGIEQELILPDPTKLYFRFNYITKNITIKEVTLGIQNGSTLNVCKKYPKVDKKQFISLIDIAKQEKIKLHLIFESDINNNKVEIYDPILCDLNYLHKSTWLKSILDRVIKYRKGYQYTNLYTTNLS